MFSFATGVAVFCSLVGAVFIGLWMFYDRRDYRRSAAERRRRAFHCIRCDAIYADGAPGEVCPCPRCGHPNARLRF